MHLQVADEMRLLREPLVAVLAQKGLFAGVHQQVLEQLAFGGECLDALVAAVVLLAGVDARVRRQVAGAGKALRAVGAAVRPLRRVYGDGVLGQLLRGRERLAARRAHVIFLAYGHKRQEGIRRRSENGADLTKNVL